MRLRRRPAVCDIIWGASHFNDLAVSPRSRPTAEIVRRYHGLRERRRRVEAEGHFRLGFIPPPSASFSARQCCGLRWNSIQAMRGTSGMGANRRSPVGHEWQLCASLGYLTDLKFVPEPDFRSRSAGRLRLTQKTEDQLAALRRVHLAELQWMRPLERPAQAGRSRRRGGIRAAGPREPQDRLDQLGHHVGRDGGRGAAASIAAPRPSRRRATKS